MVVYYSICESHYKQLSTIKKCARMKKEHDAAKKGAEILSYTIILFNDILWYIISSTVYNILCITMIYSPSLYLWDIGINDSVLWYTIQKV